MTNIGDYQAGLNLDRLLKRIYSRKVARESFRASIVWLARVT